MMTMRQGGSSDRDNSEVQLLKQQVMIYKDDFDNERRDRERAQAEKATLSERLNEITTELRVTKDQVRQKQLEVGRMSDEKKDYQRRLREVNQELARVQNRLTTYNTNPPYNPAHGQTNRISYPPQQPPPPYDTSALSQGKWTCRTCTYENTGLRSTCEMCGSQKHRGSDVPLPVEQLQTQGYCHHRLAPHGLTLGFDQCDTSETPQRQTRGQRKPTQYPRLDDIDFDATEEKL